MYISPHRLPRLLVAAGRGDSLKGKRIYVRRIRAEKKYHKRGFVRSVGGRISFGGDGGMG